MTKGSFEKFVDPYGSYGPYELKMASRIVRTVRFVKMVYGSWIKFSNPWKSQFVTMREALKNSSIRTDRTDRTNWKWLQGSYEPYGSWKGFTDREYSFSIGERIRLWLSEAQKNSSIRADRTDRTNWIMASRIVRTVRFVKRIYGSWI